MKVGYSNPSSSPFRLWWLHVVEATGQLNRGPTIRALNSSSIKVKVQHHINPPPHTHTFQEAADLVRSSDNFQTPHRPMNVI